MNDAFKLTLFNPWHAFYFENTKTTTTITKSEKKFHVDVWNCTV